MTKARVFLDGNEAIARGAVAAGCRFYAGYPITPATTIFNAMLALLPPAGGICIQGEDEIASIGACLGASMAGLKAMTATSGPGISLYSEQISFAIAGEIPLVIVDVQRLGPSTGSATRGADGDVQFLRWGNSGGLPVIVLAPTDVRDAFVLTAEAFNLAETYRSPVFIAANKEVGMTRESVDADALTLPPSVDRAGPADGRPFLPFSPPSGREVPGFAPMGGPIPVRQTSSTHGPDGYITTDPEVIARTQARLRDKILSHADQLARWEARMKQGAKTLIITYGVTARAARDARDRLIRDGRPVSLLILKTLWPVPADLIRKSAAGVRRVVVAEMNLGQYDREVARLLPDCEIRQVGRMDGQLVSPEEIMEAVGN